MNILINLTRHLILASKNVELKVSEKEELQRRIIHRKFPEYKIV